MGGAASPLHQLGVLLVGQVDRDASGPVRFRLPFPMSRPGHLLSSGVERGRPLARCDDGSCASTGLGSLPDSPSSHRRINIELRLYLPEDRDTGPRQFPAQHEAGRQTRQRPRGIAAEEIPVLSRGRCAEGARDVQIVGQALAIDDGEQGVSSCASREQAPGRNGEIPGGRSARWRGKGSSTFSTPSPPGLSTTSWWRLPLIIGENHYENRY